MDKKKQKTKQSLLKGRILIDKNKPIKKVEYKWTEPTFKKSKIDEHK